MLLALKPKHWPYVIGTGLMSLALYLALFYMQRPTYRALYIADIGAAVWLLYYLMNNIDEKKSPRRGASAVMGAAVVLITVMLMVPAYSGSESKAADAAGKTMSETMQEYFLQNEDRLYVWSTTEKKTSRIYSSPWRAPDNKDHNVAGTGGWGVLSPYILGKLAEYGVYNPIKDLIDNDKMLFVGNNHIKRLEEYYNKWYGTDKTVIYMQQVDEVDGNKIWAVKTADR